MLTILDLFARFVDFFLRPNYRIVGPDYWQYWYREGDHKVAIYFERLAPSGGVDIVVYMTSVKVWMPPHEDEGIDDKKRGQIAERLRSHLERNGTRCRITL